MSLTNKQIKDLKSLGYNLIKDSNPPKFEGGGQFSGGYWEVDLKSALESLETAYAMNKMWIKKFGKKCYSKI